MKKLLPFLGLLLFCAIPSHAACSATSLGNGVTCVQSKQTGGSAQNVAVTFSPNLTAGNLVVMILVTNDATTTLSSMSSSCGDTWHASTASPVRGTGNSTFIEWTITNGGCGTVTMQQSGSTTNTMFGAELSGIAASPFDCDSGATGNGTALAVTGCTTQAGAQSAALTANTTGQWSMLMTAFKTSTGTNDLLAAGGGGGVSSVTFTAGSGYTIYEQNGGTNHSAAFEAKTVAGAATVKRLRGSVVSN